MDINRPLPMHNLTRIEQLSGGHPVWRIDFNNDSVVLKSEGVAKQSHVSDPAEVMRIVDPSAKTRILNKRELLSLRDWVQRNVAASVIEKDAGFLDDQVTRAAAVPMPGQPFQPPVLFVMEMKQNLRDLHQAHDLKRGGDKAMVRELHQAFKQPGTLEKLGEILAADAFIGNQDRVNFEAVVRGHGRPWPEDLEPGEVRTALECVQNPGNIFVADEQGRPTVLGLDTVDPGSLFKDLNTWNEQVWYPGTLLRQDNLQQRKTICIKLVNDLNTIMGPRNRSLLKPGAKKTYMPSNSGQRISQGMVAGADKLLNQFKNRYRNGGLPPALQFRLHACGWLNRANFPIVA